MSNRWLFNGAIFIFGAAVGSVVTWKLVKTKYEQLAQEEIDSVKEALLGRNDIPEQKEDPTEIKELYTDVANQYQAEPEVKTEEQPKKSTEKSVPYVISPEEFGENDYEMRSLTYYHGDKILADYADDIISDVESVVGPDALSSFGEYEDDSVFVRDDVNQIDYEILLDTRSYFSEVSSVRPYLTEGQ